MSYTSLSLGSIIPNTAAYVNKSVLQASHAFSNVTYQQPVDSIQFRGKTEEMEPEKGLTPNYLFLKEKATQVLESVKAGKINFPTLDDQDSDYWHRVLKITIDGKPFLYEADQESSFGFRSGESHQSKSLISENDDFSITWKRDIKHRVLRSIETLTAQYKDGSQNIELSAEHPSVVQVLHELFGRLDKIYKEKRQEAGLPPDPNQGEVYENK